jgi:predicted metal-dependent enzyme (double-stranded beta helix superfamily)
VRPNPAEAVVSAIDELVAECLDAVKADRAAIAVKEVVERAVHDKRLIDELSHEPGIRRLYRAGDLTVGHVVIPKRRPGDPNPVPHNHLMWAVIGIIHGGEDNAFFRRSGDTIEPSGGRVLAEGDVLAIGSDTIHAVKNPSTEWVSSALHVYGGDLAGTARSMWCEPSLREEPYDFARVTGP